jgi:benzoyl-CoA reductase subunit C
MKSLASIPVQEGNNLLQQAINEIKDRKNQCVEKPRIMLWGSIIDDVRFIQTIEESGANVVIDDTCVGTRGYWSDVDTSNDLTGALAKRYLADIRCPRTFVSAENGSNDHLANLEARFGHIRQLAKDWRVDGVILQSVKYCDSHGFEVPDIKYYLQHLGIPGIYIEHSYNEASVLPLKTRVEAFLEMLHRPA